MSISPLSLPSPASSLWSWHDVVSSPPSPPLSESEPPLGPLPAAVFPCPLGVPLGPPSPLPVAVSPCPWGVPLASLTSRFQPKRSTRVPQKVAPPVLYAAVLAFAGCPVAWAERGTGHWQVRFGGAILNFWPSTHTLHLQGRWEQAQEEHFAELIGQSESVV